MNQEHPARNFSELFKSPFPGAQTDHIRLSSVSWDKNHWHLGPMRSFVGSRHQDLGQGVWEEDHDHAITIIHHRLFALDIFSWKNVQHRQFVSRIVLWGPGNSFYWWFPGGPLVELNYWTMHAQDKINAWNPDCFIENSRPFHQVDWLIDMRSSHCQGFGHFWGFSWFCHMSCTSFERMFLLFGRGRSDLRLLDVIGGCSLVSFSLAKCHRPGHPRVPYKPCWIYFWHSWQ